MVIFGAGHISTQVSKIAVIAGFRTTIVDNRPVYANNERFPEAERIYSESFEEAFEAITPTENTYLVIVTRGHQEDENVLRWAVGTNARYIGMIGSKRKIRTIADNLTREGIDRERIERVHMPIGLDIGAVTPEEIAVAIVAEAIQIRRVGFKHPHEQEAFSGQSLLVSRAGSVSMKIYTKTGDKGDTRLFDGTQVRKNDPRVEAYGDVDELNSFIGAAASFLQDEELKAILRIFSGTSSQWAHSWPIPSSTERSRSRGWIPPGSRRSRKPSIVLKRNCRPYVSSFWPGGAPAGAMLHVARTVCRRAERRVVALADSVEDRSACDRVSEQIV